VAAQCFECFIGQKTAAEYWEVNLAPNGDWNVYHFDGYRTGMVEETALRRLPCAFHAGRNEVRVGMEVDLSPIIREEQTSSWGSAPSSNTATGRCRTGPFAIGEREPTSITVRVLS